jgi:hypothetical protein
MTMASYRLQCNDSMRLRAQGKLTPTAQSFIPSHILLKHLEKEEETLTASRSHLVMSCPDRHHKLTLNLCLSPCFDVVDEDLSIGRNEGDPRFACENNGPLIGN